MGVFPSLKSLDLSFNKLSQFKDCANDPWESSALELLVLDKNRIRNFKGFPKCPGLKFVFFRGNRSRP